jgi:hypothetical protein
MTRQIPEIDTTRPRFRDHHALEAERELKRIQQNRARAPRAAALLDEIAPQIEAGMAPIYVEVTWFFLDSRVERGVDLTDAEERQVRRILAPPQVIDDGH